MSPSGFMADFNIAKQGLWPSKVLVQAGFAHWSSFSVRGGARNFPTGGLIPPTRGLKYGFQGTINAKNLRKCRFHFPTGG